MVKEKTKPSVQLITITSDRAGQRIDNFLLTTLKGVPRSHIYKLLRNGEIRVNKGRIKPTYRLKIDDIVRLPPIKTSAAKSNPSKYSKQIALIKDEILFEDNDLIILNKPSGMAVHGGSGVSYGVIEALRFIFPKMRSLELVHRLDRETSGCLMIAKKRSMLRSLHEYFREGSIEKRYLALVKGIWPENVCCVEAPLLRDDYRLGERCVRVHPEGKYARTDFHVQQVFNDASLVEAHLHTGRTHQIRVHAAHHQCPIIGDSRYGDTKFNKAMQARGLSRLFLHARYLRFIHPKTQENIAVTAPLDTELTHTLAQLKH